MVKIIRQNYIEQLKSLREKNLIKVITGIRRSGKSVLLSQYQDYLRQDGVKDEQIILLNFEELENADLRDYKKLYEYLKSRFYKNGWTYIFLDEIQKVDKFQECVDSLYVKPNVDIYITGSNAKLLSSELATLLSGRYISFHLLPFSFAEFLKANGIKKYDNENIETKTKVSLLFDKYLINGGFPETLNLSNKQDTNKYLTSIFDTIVEKDIKDRDARISKNLGIKPVVDETLLKNVTRFLFQNAGSEISINNIAKYLKTDKAETSYNTISRYIEFLCESYIIYEAKRYDVKGKALLKTLSKYYVVDNGLRNSLLSGKDSDIGHLLENLVYLELLRRNYKVTVGKVDRSEVDFIAENNDGIKYFQVSATILDETVRERELKPLNMLKDHFPKYLITLDKYNTNTTFNGIKVVNAIDFLLEKF